MPTYEYRCPQGHDFEKFYKKISDAESQVACPECGKIGERRMSAGGGLVFKGSGFYITDYGKDGKKSAASSTTPSADKKDAATSTPKPDSGGSSSAAPGGSGSTGGSGNSGTSGGSGGSGSTGGSTPKSGE